MFFLLSQTYPFSSPLGHQPIILSKSQTYMCTDSPESFPKDLRKDSLNVVWLPVTLSVNKGLAALISSATGGWQKVMLEFRLRGSRRRVTMDKQKNTLGCHIQKALQNNMTLRGLLYEWCSSYLMSNAISLPTYTHVLFILSFIICHSSLAAALPLFLFPCPLSLLLWVLRREDVFPHNRNK